MLFPIGMLVVIGSVLGGYVMHGGHLVVLWQPTEFIVIFGAGIGSFIIGNPSHVSKGALSRFKTLFKGKPYTTQSYLDLLCFMFTVFKIMKTKGMLELESHIENPHESDMFNKFPSFAADHHAVEFFCDYIRILTMGVDDFYQMEDLMDKELETHHHEGVTQATAMNTMAEAFPALGIVAAVQGVIITMGSITEPPEVLGHLIGGALVGTFLGVLLCYGIFGPIASFMNKFVDAESKYYEVIKIGIISHMKGNAPMISVEFARKVITSDVRPSFKELEEATAAATA
ncbi:MAG: flagellar motor stator protein MotA [Proteobacteria bacterium]|nr:flagellar motor stator protein MotA [Pseudomonadota bacterium]